MLKLFFFKNFKILVLGLSISLFISCSNEESNAGLKNHIKNDFESYEGWSGINGYALYTKDAYSGTHCWLTDTAHAFSLTFARTLKELSPQPIKKFKMNAWIKLTNSSAKGAYVLSIERDNKTLAYFSFDSENFVKGATQWYHINGDAQLPDNLPPDAVVKIYFWNKGQSPILVDDAEFSFE